METRSAKRKRLLNRVRSSPDGDDRLSDLPDAILHHIFFLLPIKTVAQTSVLSKRWRQLWYSFPDLDFTTINPFANAPVKISSTGRKKVHSWIANGADSINQVLALRDRNSPIRALRFRAHVTFSRLNRLMRRAVKLNVQELDIEVATNDYFNFPRSVISCETLRVFKLKSRYPGFRLPPSPIMKGGFQSLHTLSLSYIILYDQPSLLNLFTDSSFPLLKKLNLDGCNGLMHLSVSCRALEELSLENCCQLEHLDIVGSKLERLRVISCFDSYSNDSLVKIDAQRLESIFWSNNTITDKCCLQNLISLHGAFIGFFILFEDLSAVKLRSVSNFLSGIASSQCLILEYQCVEILSKNNHIAGVSLCCFSKLQSLELHTGFNKHNIPGLANLFRSAPAIHTLIIKIINDHNVERRPWNRDLWQLSSTVEERFWESQSQVMKSFLQHLKIVKIHGFSECENEISLVKFLLKHGKVLEEMFLYGGFSKSRDSLHREKIKSQIMGFSRASGNAKIAFD
nr:putative F-box/FBD/LRR-repeat protein At4g03220 [Ipomoea batatas]GMC72866.1 putative F-box/FBD/LRR-repeat protein At4g03220 [Ipomoea batatas]GMC72867.1 putative F-box/FBD/LRR-repeat protein At4g03220 [Ipomoea batatas]